MLVYISGPYTADTPEGVQLNIAAAADLAGQWMEAGHSVICPHTNSGGIEKVGYTFDWDRWIKADLEIIARCDAVVVLPDCGSSRGAIAEMEFAWENGIPILTANGVYFHVKMDGEWGLKTSNLKPMERKMQPTTTEETQVQLQNDGPHDSMNAPYTACVMPSNPKIAELQAKRGAEYGEPKYNLSGIGLAWTGYIQNKYQIELPSPLTEHDVAMMNCQQKINRLARSPKHQDSFADLHSYADLAEKA